MRPPPRCLRSSIQKPGAVIGAKLVTKVPERTLRLLFGCFLIVAAVMLVLNEVGVLG